MIGLCRGNDGLEAFSYQVHRGGRFSRRPSAGSATHQNQCAVIDSFETPAVTPDSWPRRRIVTTLNKYARPVSQAGLIALNDDDAFAIVTRRLIDEVPGTGSGRRCAPRVILRFARGDGGGYVWRQDVHCNRDLRPCPMPPATLGRTVGCLSRRTLMDGAP